MNYQFTDYVTPRALRHWFNHFRAKNIPFRLVRGRTRRGIRGVAIFINYKPLDAEGFYKIGWVVAEGWR